MNKIFQFIYNLKRSIIIFMAFLTFYALVEFNSRSLVNWGFLIITSMLFYIELSFSLKSISLK